MQVCPTDYVRRENMVVKCKYIKLFFFFIILVPPDPPQILEAPIAAVILGKPTNITCLVKNGKPGAKITWYLAGKLMNRKLYSTDMFTKPNKRVDTKGNIMLIPKTEHSGKQLECRAINEALQNPYETRVTLNVQCK